MSVYAYIKFCFEMSLVFIDLIILISNDCKISIMLNITNTIKSYFIFVHLADITHVQQLNKI